MTKLKSFCVLENEVLGGTPQQAFCICAHKCVAYYNIRHSICVHTLAKKTERNYKSFRPVYLETDAMLCFCITALSA